MKKPPHTNNLYEKTSHTNHCTLTICMKNHHILTIRMKNHQTNIVRINIFVVINQINKHTVKIYNQCTYTQIIIKKLYFFFFIEYKNDKKIKKVTSTITKTKKYLI